MFIWSFRVQVCFPLPPATWVSSKRHNCLVTAAMIKLWMMKHVADYEDVYVKNSLKIDFPRLWRYNMDDGIMDIKATWSSESWNRSFRLHTWAQSNAPRHRVHSKPTWSWCQNIVRVIQSMSNQQHGVYVIIHDHLMEQTMWTTRRDGQPFQASDMIDPTTYPTNVVTFASLSQFRFVSTFPHWLQRKNFGNWKVEACHVRISCTQGLRNSGDIMHHQTLRTNILSSQQFHKYYSINQTLSIGVRLRKEISTRFHRMVKFAPPFLSS